MLRKQTLASLTVVTAAALALAACGSSGSGGSKTSATGGSTTTQSSAKATQAAGAPVPSTFPTVAAGPGTIVYAADQEQTGFNNLTSKDNGTAATNILESVWPSASYGQPDLTFAFSKFLFTEDPKQTSASPQTIEYKINPKAVWSDGTPIDVNDFIFNWKAQNGTDKNYDVANTSGYNLIDSIKQGTDSKDVIVTFKSPYSDWAGLFSPLVPAHIIEGLKSKFGGSVEKAWNDGLDNSPVVSGGPYMVSEYKPTDHLTLVPNPKWYGDPPKLSSIVFRYITDSTQEPQALQNGEVGLIYPQPQLDEVQQIAKLPNIKSELNFGLSFTNPFLADQKIRQAIVTAINRPAILARTVKQFSDKATPLGNSIWLSNQKPYVDHTPAGETVGDAAAAAKILEGDGYTKDATGYYAKAGKELELKFTTTAGNALRESTATLFQQEMKAAGIKIDLDERASKVVFPDLSNGKFDISLFAWVNTTFPASGTEQLYTTGEAKYFYELMETGSDSNYGKWSDPTIDSLAKKAVGDTDSTTEAADLNKIDQQLWADSYTIPLFQKPTYIAYDQKYVNVHDNPTSDGPFYNAYTWGTKAQ